MAAISAKIKIFQKARVIHQIFIKSSSGANFSSIGQPQLKKTRYKCRKRPFSQSPDMAQNSRIKRFSHKNQPMQKNWCTNHNFFNQNLLVGTGTILKNLNQLVQKCFQLQNEENEPIFNQFSYIIYIGKTAIFDIPSSTETHIT